MPRELRASHARNKQLISATLTAVLPFEPRASPSDARSVNLAAVRPRSHSWALRLYHAPLGNNFLEGWLLFHWADGGAPRRSTLREAGFTAIGGEPAESGCQ